MAEAPTSTSSTALRRKMVASSNAAPRGERSALRALRLALARAADHIFGLPLFVIGATQSRCAIDGLPKRLKEDRLLILLDGPQGQIGALSADRATVAAITQQQTMGKVTGAPPPDRGFTITDAALVAPLIDALLKRAKDLTDIPHDRQCLAGYRFGARSDDLRSLVLTLEADRFRVFDLTVDFAGGVKQGNICIALPEPQDLEPEADMGQAAPVRRGPRMEQALGAVRAEMTAVICRVRLPLAEVTSLKAGDLVPLMQRRLDETALISITGRRVGTGRLGQIDGMRAIRLNETLTDVDGRSTPVPGAFSTQVMALTGADDDDEEEMAFGGTALSALSDGASGMGPGDDGDARFAGLSPEEAAVEISELAGLSLDMAEDEEPA